MKEADPTFTLPAKITPEAISAFRNDLEYYELTIQGFEKLLELLGEDFDISIPETLKAEPFKDLVRNLREDFEIYKNMLTESEDLINQFTKT